MISRFLTWFYRTQLNYLRLTKERREMFAKGWMYKRMGEEE